MRAIKRQTDPNVVVAMALPGLVIACSSFSVTLLKLSPALTLLVVVLGALAALASGYVVGAGYKVPGLFSSLLGGNHIIALLELVFGGLLVGWTVTLVFLNVGKLHTTIPSDSLYAAELIMLIFAGLGGLSFFVLMWNGFMRSANNALQKLSGFVLTTFPCYQLILEYRNNAGEPDMSLYGWQTVALAAISISWMYVTGLMFSNDRVKPGRAVFWLQLATAMTAAGTAAETTPYLRNILIFHWTSLTLTELLILLNLQPRVVAPVAGEKPLPATPVKPIESVEATEPVQSIEPIEPIELSGAGVSLEVASASEEPPIPTAPFATAEAAEAGTGAAGADAVEAVLNELATMTTTAPGVPIETTAEGPTPALSPTVPTPTTPAVAMPVATEAAVLPEEPIVPLQLELASEPATSILSALFKQAEELEALEVSETQAQTEPVEPMVVPDESEELPKPEKFAKPAKVRDEIDAMFDIYE